MISKCHGVFTENFTIFCQMREKLKTCQKIYLKEFHISHRHLTVQVKNSCTLASLCVFYFTGSKFYWKLFYWSLFYFTGNKCLKFS